jgi:hypothetical protein
MMKKEREKGIERYFKGRKRKTPNDIKKDFLVFFVKESYREYDG